MERRTFDPLAVRWRAQPDDLIGGWCATWESDERTPAEGAIGLVECVNEATALHVADLHNKWLTGRP